MKVLLIAPISSIHVIRWANALIKQGIDLHIATMHNAIEKLDERIVIHKLPYRSPFGYITNYRALRRLFIDLSPDIIHTHQLTGHATTTALAYRNINIPYLLSMYGSDIYDFPNKSIFHKKLISWVSKKASRLASTSVAMRNQFYKIVPDFTEKIFITPFGVDINKFKPTLDIAKNSKFNIGIAKRIEDKYGIKYLIEAFSNFNEKHGNSELHIIGQGTRLNDLIIYTKELGIDNRVIFYGRIDNYILSKHIASWDVCVIPSILDSESFGVSAVEASSCGIPVIASNVGGLPEVVDDEKTGFIVSKESSIEIEKKLEVLYNDPDLRKIMGVSGRKKVLENYDWDKNVSHMINIYKELINS